MSGKYASALVLSSSLCLISVSPNVVIYHRELLKDKSWKNTKERAR